ncbi:MFS transporter [Thiotrichales bacterium 19X7-9]|nr:MFS transporter [Thiotrichales bacterium 19X7-9]
MKRNCDSFNTPLLAAGIFIYSVITRFYFFLITEYKTKSPLLPLSLFRNHYILIGCIIYTICVSSAWVISFYSPLYLATVFKFNPGEIGLMMLVMTVFTAIIPAFAGGLYDKKGVHVAVRLVFIPLILSYLLFIALYYTTNLWVLIFAFALFGIAWGAGNGIGMPVSLSKLESNDDVGVVSGAVLTVFNTLGVIFLTLAGIIFYHIQKSVLISSFKLKEVQLTEEKLSLINQLVNDPQKKQQILDQIASLPSTELTKIYQQSFLSGYISIAFILLCITVLAFVIYKVLK